MTVPQSYLSKAWHHGTIWTKHIFQGSPLNYGWHPLENPWKKICKNQLTDVSHGRGVEFFLLPKKWWDEEKSNSWDVCFEAGIGSVKSWATLLGGILEDVEGGGREIDKHAFCRRIFECAHGLCVCNTDKCSTIRWWSNLIPNESGSRNAEPGRASVRPKSRNVVRNRDFSKSTW